MSETLILVDENDKSIGTAEKMKVHIEGLLHRAFSVMIFNSKGQLLVQKRAKSKYHSAKLWANSCCGHPRLDEGNMKAAQRRLQEELGFTCNLIKITELSYSLKLQDGLYEREYTHVFAGIYDGSLELNPDEVSEIKWQTPNDLRRESISKTDQYARWFNLYLTEYYREIFENNALLSL